MPSELLRQASDALSDDSWSGHAPEHAAAAAGGLAAASPAESVANLQPVTVPNQQSLEELQPAPLHHAAAEPCPVKGVGFAETGGASEPAAPQWPPRETSPSMQSEPASPAAASVGTSLSALSPGKSQALYLAALMQVGPDHHCSRCFAVRADGLVGTHGICSSQGAACIALRVSVAPHVSRRGSEKNAGASLFPFLSALAALNRELYLSTCSLQLQRSEQLQNWTMIDSFCL